jgi:hypothetical protein
MLNSNQLRRITPAEALEHSWIRGVARCVCVCDMHMCMLACSPLSRPFAFSPTVISESVLRSLKSFTAASRLQVAVLDQMSTLLSEEEQYRLSVRAASLPAHPPGAAGRARDLMGAVQATFRQMDTNRDGTISVQELMVVSTACSWPCARGAGSTRTSPVHARAYAGLASSAAQH